MAVPYTFATATSSIPLSQLDSNFATAITLGNTAIYLGNTTTSIGNLTLTNTTISSVAVTFPNSYLANSSVTIGSTNVSLGGTAATIAGLTLTGATLGGTFSGTSVTDSGLTSGRVTYATTGGLLTDSANMTFNGTTLTTANDASISGLTVGKGGGSLGTNTAVGNVALPINTTGGYTTALGYGALYVNTTGVQNTSVGANSMIANTTGGYNVAVGSSALQANTTASNNTAVGYQAGYSNTTGANNFYGGAFAGYTGTTASYNVGIGYYAMQNATGSDNVAVGYYTLQNSSGSYNTALGEQALRNNTTASNNTAVGYQAGYSQTIGTSNLYLGNASGYSSVANNNNTFVGSAAGYYVSSGNKNTILGTYNGNQGGLDIRTASNYIVLSDGDGNPRLVVDNNGYASIGSTTPAANSKNSQLLLKSGDISATAYGLTIVNNANSTGGKFINFVNYNDASAGSISQATSTTVLFNTTSDYRLKIVVGSITDSGQRIDALEPIEFDWNIGGRTKGFLAHKFAEVYPNSVTGEKDALDAEGKPIYQQMQASTSEVMADLIAEIQSLRKRVAQLESK